MPVTSPDNIYYPDTSTANAPSVYTGAMADSVQAALDVANGRIDAVEADIEYEEILSPITANAGFTINSSARRSGKVVQIGFSVTKSSNYGVNSDTFGTVMASIRPFRVSTGLVYNNGGGPTLGVNLQTNGSISLLFPNGVAGTSNMIGTITYIIP